MTARESQVGRLPDGYVYALPTEAQWEYACRAGTTTAYSFGDDPSVLGEYAWYVKNALEPGERYAHRVGLKKPNPWGFYDLHGNAWQWCRDFYAEKLPGGTDPLVGNGSFHVPRGGCWFLNAQCCRSAYRPDNAPGLCSDRLGFRVALVPADEMIARAIAPFDAAKAKQHQEEWAKYLGVPVVETNSIGMKLVRHPPGEFQMGSPKELIEEELGGTPMPSTTGTVYRTRGPSTGFGLPSHFGWECI